MEAFQLIPPEPARPGTKRPDWWLATLERATREHRRGRAQRLREAHLDRVYEAEWVRHIVTRGFQDEFGVPFQSELRPLPQGVVDWELWPRRDGEPTTWLAAILLKWDREIRQNTRGERRLDRGEWETVHQWRDRVMAEAERRIESRWHAERARGQEERFKRVATCGDEHRGFLTCTTCKVRAHPQPLVDCCESVFLCQRCRDHRAKKYRAKFLRARKAAVTSAARARVDRGGDRIGEKFLTLTSPHIPVELGGPERQARIVRDAWRKFMNAVRNHWRGRRAFRFSRYVRVLESTEGAGAEGHTHVHAWLYCPFTRDAIVAVLWGRALLAAGFPRELWPESAYRDKSELLDYLASKGDERAHKWAKHCLPKRIPWPIVELKAVRPNPKRPELADGGDLAVELIKYLTKDLESDGRGGLRPIHPETFAALYRGLDGARLLTAARGFWVVYRVHCEHCGCVGTLRPVEAPGTRDDALPRGPPTLELCR